MALNENLFENKDKLNSIFGHLSKSKTGHWQVVTSIEGNWGELWHRLIWERFHQRKIPKGYHVHHIDGNPSNNCIMNLCILPAREHVRLHKKGGKLSQEHKDKISKSMLGNEKSIKSHLGNAHTDETKQKMSKTHTGMVNPKNSTKYIEIRKSGSVYVYYEKGLSKNRLKRSKYFDKIVNWANENSMPLTINEKYVGV